MGKWGNEEDENSVNQGNRETEWESGWSLILVSGSQFLSPFVRFAISPFTHFPFSSDVLVA